MKKAYDRVSWKFLFDMLEVRNFDHLWIGWIKQIVIGGSVGIMLNGEDSAFLRQEKVLGRGTPIPFPVQFGR